MISVGTVTSTGRKENVSSYTFSHTTTATTKVLVVCVMNLDGGGKNNINAITFDGDALTTGHVQIEADDYAGAGIKYLVNPSIGAHTVSVTVDTTTNRSCAFAINVDGIDYANAIEGDNGTDGTGSPSTPITTAKPETIIIDAFSTERDSNLTIGTGQTLIGAQIDMNSGRAGVSYELFTSDGIKTQFWTGTGRHAHVAVAFNASNAGGAFIFNML